MKNKHYVVAMCFQTRQIKHPRQVQHYTSYINGNPVWTFAGIYSDNGLSGKDAAKRPEFMRMVQDAENKKFDLIITKSISRFARSTQDCLETVRKLKLLGIAILFEKEQINTLTAESELMLSILSSVAEEELASISQNMHWSNQRRFKKGKFSVNTKRFRRKVRTYRKSPKWESPTVFRKGKF